MSALLRSLLEGIIDYAGLFPPARQPMADAVASYLKYRSGKENWIVSRFLCPSARLAELERHIGGAPAFPVGVIGTSGADYDAFQTGLEADAKAMTAFEENLGDHAPIEAFEVRAPADAPINRVASDLRGFDSVEVFLELPWGLPQLENLAVLAGEEWLGAKARTGGLEAAAFPPSHDLAAFLKSCQDLDLPFKLTAGLHHPLPTFDVDIGVQMHGFANVLAAMALNDANDLSTLEMAGILDANDVTWADDMVSCEGIQATAEQASDVRTLFVGFGSCSVDEPLHDLDKLGLVGGVRS